LTLRIGINGFGRIGRLVLRAAFDRPEIEVVAVNDLDASQTLAHLLKYDSVHGIFPPDVEASESGMLVGGRSIAVLAEREPSRLPWARLGVDVVVESTGRFTSRDGAARHLEAGAGRVVISAPAKGEDITIVMGVNEDDYNPQSHRIISNASCTTNCLAPLAKVIDDQFGIARGMMTTVHSYTNDQRILDLPHEDLRRARAAAMSIIPTTTGAAQAVGRVLPSLRGRLTGLAMRVPTANVSVVDLVAVLAKPCTAREVNRALEDAARGPLSRIMEYCPLPLVSRDFNGNPHSCIVDGLSTMVVDNMVKLVAWYDNEWGYSNRIVDLLAYISNG